MGDEYLTQSYPENSANISFPRKKDKEMYRDQEARRSRRASRRSAGKDRRNSAHEREKADKTLFAAGKTLFSGIKNALAKA